MTAQTLDIQKLIENRQFVSAQDYFEYQDMVARLNQSAADEWIMLKAYGLTAPQINNELTFEDRVALDKALNEVPETEKIERVNLSGAAYTLFKSKVAKDSNAAIKWLVGQAFSVNGTTFKDCDPSTISYGTANALIVKSSAFF